MKSGQVHDGGQLCVSRHLPYDFLGHCHCFSSNKSNVVAEVVIYIVLIQALLTHHIPGDCEKRF